MDNSGYKVTWPGSSQQRKNQQLALYLAKTLALHHNFGVQSRMSPEATSGFALDHQALL